MPKPGKPIKETLVLCRPNAFLTATKTINQLFQHFSNNFVNKKENGDLIEMICDFIEDENGNMIFMKIRSCKMSGHKSIYDDWVTSKIYFANQP